MELKAAFLYPHNNLSGEVKLRDDERANVTQGSILTWG